MIRRLHSHGKHIKEHTLVIVVAPLLAEGLEEFKQAIPDSSPVLLVEFDKEIYEYCKQESPLLSQQHYYRKEAEVMEAIQQLSRTYALQGCYSIFYSKQGYSYATALKTIEQKTQQLLFQYWSNQATLHTMGYLYLRNTWRNLAREQLSSFSQAIENNTSLKKLDCIIVGAGPSLDKKHLAYLHENQEQLCIIAVDSAMPILQSYAITADFCIILESQWYNMHDFLPKPSSSTIAIVDTSAYPPSIQDFDISYFVSTQFDVLSFFSQYKQKLPYIVPALGSVGLLALYLAFLLSFKQIFLIGMDFSYYLGKTHANNSAPHTSWLIHHTRTSSSSSVLHQFENASLQRIKNASRRLSDAVLQRYAVDADELIQFAGNKKNIPVYDLNYKHSVLTSAQAMSLEHFDDTIQANIENKHKHHYLDELRNNYTKNTHRNDTQSILHSELAKYQQLQQRLIELQELQSLPNEHDWKEHGLDMCSYSLFFNAYKLRHSHSYWEENAIFTRMSLMIQRSIQELKKIIP